MPIVFNAIFAALNNLFLRMNTKSVRIAFLALSSLMLSTGVKAQSKIVKDGDFYFSWGYNTEWYTHSNIHVSQPGQNSDFTFMDVTAHDHKGWDNNLLHKDISIPQYNYRIGYFFNEKQDWGFEINFDHTKYVVQYGQSVRLKGTLNGRSVDTTVVTNESALLWMLNNGANFLQFNLVKKLKILDLCSSKIQFDCLLKAGVGPTIPHVENTIFGHDNVPHFQFGGWNADADVSFKLNFFKHIFIEYQSKVVYGRYFGLKVYDGRADQHFGCYEMALVIGGSFRL
jgi:hypothetical protein